MLFLDGFGFFEEDEGGLHAYSFFHMHAEFVDDGVKEITS